MIGLVPHLYFCYILAMEPPVFLRYVKHYGMKSIYNFKFLFTNLYTFLIKQNIICQFQTIP